MDVKESTLMTAHDEKFERDLQQQTVGEEGGWQATLAEAQAANAHEHSLTVREALKAYPWAVFWSLVVSMSIIMEGYDTILIGVSCSVPQNLYR